MKRTYEEASGGTTPSLSGSKTSPGASESSPSAKAGRMSASNSPISTSAAPPPIPSIFADSTGRITRIPTISRKVRACSACKKQKIRCDFEEGESTCVRCKKMKLECVVNRSLQTILDEDVEWKQKMREDTVQLQRAMDDVLQVLNMRTLGSYQTVSPPMSRNSSEPPSVRAQTSNSTPAMQSVRFQEPSPRSAPAKIEEEIEQRLIMTRDGSQETHENDGSLYSNPMGSLYEVTKLRGLRSSCLNHRASIHSSELEVDFVSRGILSISEAQELFELFRDNLNHYLYSIALPYEDLAVARASSSLLTAAIYTVASLHLPQYHNIFPSLYREFLGLVSSSMFERHHRIDDIRGLCIGAFWLMDISWKLSGHAVRIATELNIHLSFRKALAGSKEHFERARLWYLLYVCDHHFSIAYGRPPMISDHEPMIKYELYLQSPMAIAGDHRVLSQVSLLVILSRIYHCFEDDAESEIPEEKLSQLSAFEDQLNAWRTRWHSQLRRNDFVGDYPGRGVDLHFHFARFQLNALALRGALPHTTQNLSPHRRERANLAIASAMAVLSTILNEPPIRESLVGVPLYINTMVAFAAVFLLKVTTKWKSIGFDISSNETWNLVERVIALLKSRQASDNHIIPPMAAGLERMLHNCMQFARSNSPIEESRLWDPLSHNGATAPSSNGVPTEDVKHNPNQPPTSAAGNLAYSVGQPQQVWQGYQMRQAPDGQVYTPPPHHPHAMAAGPGQPAMYEVNGQYFPMHMGVFDFLSPQLPY